MRRTGCPDHFGLPCLDERGAGVLKGAAAAHPCVPARRSYAVGRWFKDANTRQSVAVPDTFDKLSRKGRMGIDRSRRDAVAEMPQPFDPMPLVHSAASVSSVAMKPPD